jgi:hypothetical protein
MTRARRPAYQYHALAAETAAVLLVGCRRLDHRAHARLASLVDQRRTNQRLAVDVVGPAGTTPGGKKELIGFQTSMRESTQSWKELLVDLKAGGLSLDGVAL